MEKKDSEFSLVEQDLEKRKKEVYNFFKKKISWIFYICLAFATFLGIYIRTLNISKLKDVTTGGWTLGPDLDPFLFLRWSQYIVAHGKLMANDLMRYVPLGYDTSGEMKLLAYLMAWTHKFLEFFSLSNDVTYSAILFPVIMFGLTTIAFFLFTKEIFYKEDSKIKNSIAVIATLFFVLIPSLLPRTIAGIPEKESAAFFFIFMSFYFFMIAYRQEKLSRGVIFAILSGVSTGMLGLIWGGVGFSIMTIAGAVFITFILGNIKRNNFYCYLTWIVSWIAVMMPFSTRYSLGNLVESTTTGMAFGVLLILLVDISFYKRNIFGTKTLYPKKIPPEISSVLVSLILFLIVISIVINPGFIFNKVTEVVSETIHPLDVSRFGLTVAENKQPYFTTEWKGEFGPTSISIKNLTLETPPLYFWMFFIGAVALFGSMIKSFNKKERGVLIFAYFVFLMGLIFSKYAPHPSALDGEGNLSLLVYFGGLIFFLGCFIYFYYKKFKTKEVEIFKNIEFSYLLYFIIFTMAIIGARGAVRLVLVLGAITPVVASFLIVVSGKKFLEEKRESKKIFFALITIGLIFSGGITMHSYYQGDKSLGENYAPYAYTEQWQYAMSWVRENTSTDSVFAHWWDYGYWVQTIGERSTVLDGGNAITYWDYLMGRYVLTGNNEQEALEFLYTHNATHLLIDSSDIGKYPAFSSIGSDENYDRFSSIRIFQMDESQTQETSNKTVLVYTGGGITNDEDILWKEGNKEIFVPRNRGIIAGILLEKDKKENLGQPKVVLVYNNQRYFIPIKHIIIDGEEKIEFEEGLNSGVFLFPSINSATSNGISVNNIGALMYLSNKTINSNLARFYIFGEQSPNFKLVHTEEDLAVKQLKSMGVPLRDFVLYGDLRGPIKIWEINYPEGTKVNEEYLKTVYPNPELEIANSGEY